MELLVCFSVIGIPAILFGIMWVASCIIDVLNAREHREFMARVKAPRKEG